MVADELVMERFRLLDRIGSGGMGTVYRAFDERLQREVAVKEIPAPEPARVLREAQAAARLNHPGIVTLYELGEQRGSAVLVSELVEGRTLHSLQAAGELSDREVGEVALDICEALAHAHARGVVHRDLKPQNVIVRDDRSTPQRAKLLDFGIARLGGAPTLTATGEVVGTLAYMSPEQAEGWPAGPESDVYSLALTVYECYSGSNPVAGATPAATARRIGGPVAPLGELRPDLPEGLADLIDACLDANPALRPSAAELAECLEAELAALDPDQLVPLPDGASEAAADASFDVGRLAVLAGAVAVAPLLSALGLGAAAAAL
ncbi:MAG TPA: serine/threonine-protein kinase, partial [Solirubrobacterales bacterium]|nr:serine/threonine-protein kinase [Solirubrobacterales bacterium]